MDEVRGDSTEQGESGWKNAGGCEMWCIWEIVFSAELWAYLGKCEERQGPKLI